MEYLANIIFQLVRNTVKVQPGTVELCSLTFVKRQSIYWLHADLSSAQYIPSTARRCQFSNR